MMDAASNRRWVLAIAIGAASLSGLALLLHAFAGWKIAFSLTVLGPLTAVLGLSAHALARPEVRPVFLQRLWAGAFAGFIGLLAYDGGRALILLLGIVPFNPFRAIEKFGLLITDSDVDTTWTKTLGWLFHTWNGLGFGAMFTLAFGRGTIFRAVAWSMLLESAMIATYPSLFRIQLDWPFLSMSILGHLFYGLALGWTAKRVVEQ